MLLKVFFIVFFGGIGVCIGSFLNVLVARLDRKRGLFFGRSECPRCKHQLSWNDLIPILSFIFLRGRCRYCRKDISSRYPIVEAITGISVAAFTFFHIDSYSMHDWPLIIVLIGFLALIFFDVRYYILPDKIIFPMIVIAIAFHIFLSGPGLINIIVSGFVLSGAFAILYVVSAGRWIGFGDVKLAGLVGFMFGYPVSLIVLIFSVWAGALFGVGLLILRKASMKTALPFGAFIGGISVLAIIFYHDLAILQRFLP